MKFLSRVRGEYFFLALFVFAVLAIEAHDATAKPARSRKVRQEVFLTVGDSIAPAYTILTDSVLGVRGFTIVAKKVGRSIAFLRFYAPASGGNPRTLLTVDSVDIIVRAAGSTRTPPARAVRVTVCKLTDTVAFQQYKVSGDTTIDPALVPCLPGGDTLTVGAGSRLTATAYDSLGNVLTGRHIQWTIPPLAAVRPQS